MDMDVQFTSYQVYLCAMTVLVFTKGLIECLILSVILPVVMKFAQILICEKTSAKLDITEGALNNEIVEKKLPRSISRKHVSPAVDLFYKAIQFCERREDTDVNHVFKSSYNNFIYDENEKMWISSAEIPYYKLVKKETGWCVTEVGMMKAIFSNNHFNKEKCYETNVCRFSIPR